MLLLKTPLFYLNLNPPNTPHPWREPLAEPLHSLPSRASLIPQARPIPKPLVFKIKVIFLGIFYYYRNQLFVGLIKFKLRFKLRFIVFYHAIIKIDDNKDQIYFCMYGSMSHLDFFSPLFSVTKATVLPLLKKKYQCYARTLVLYFSYHRRK